MSDEMRGVGIWCLSADHPTKRVFIAGLSRHADGRWRSDGGSHFGREIPGGMQVLDRSAQDQGRPEPGLTISSDGSQMPSIEIAKEHLGEWRRRFTLTCPLCQTTVTCRGEKLDRILDDLTARADANEPLLAGIVTLSLPLGLLAARVTSA